MESIAPFPPSPAVLFHVTPFHDALLFSCISSTGRYESGKRTVVSYQRNGRWHCQACGFAATCKHIPHAKHFAQDAGLLGPDSSLGLGSTGSTMTGDGSDAGISSTDDSLLLLQAATRSDSEDASGTCASAVSHLAAPPPRWCSLPHEDAFMSPRLTHGQRKDFPYDSTARCVCGYSESASSNAEAAHKRAPPISRVATLYGLTESTSVTIGLRSCPNCKHARRLMGPDLGSYGLFNWNNHILFTHELLNAYTNAYTASETPFSAFCLTIRRSYMDHDITMKFCSDETFVRVWFAFAKIQQLDSEMKCPVCGPYPQVVIADGISLSTHTSKLVSTIRPPTFTDTSSERIESVSSYGARRLPAIPEAHLRATSLRLIAHIADCNILDIRLSSDANLPQLIHAYPIYSSFLQMLAMAQVQRSVHLGVYRKLAMQVAAPDIILQLVPYEAIAILMQISLSLTFEPPIHLQRLIPALGAVIHSHRMKKTSLPFEVRAVAGWLAARADEVFTQLSKHDPSSILDLSILEQPWQETGTFYGMPAVRRCRIYSKLRHDAQPLDQDAEESTNIGGDCNKFYKTYSKNNLAGGILVLWCTHSICLGFHSIPIAEGRNDVFSAIYTRFPNAPEVIIYDFACQLASYCLVREARYFQNTRFLIDEMHAHDHTKCGQACFASNYMQYDDRVRAANTSAAECGNKGMKRIRKSVSFMTYRHAVIYTKVFLDVWNRSKIIRMSA